MNLKRHLLLLPLVLALVSSVQATAVVPAGSNAGKMPNIAVWDEANLQTTLWDKLRAAGSGPVIVLPVYTRCTMSCPIMARMLVKETAQIGGNAPYRVLIFSFDAGEDSASLTKFRQTEGLPPTWLLVRSDAVDIRTFCDFFHYSVLTEGPVMIHLNQFFLLDHTLRWRATFIDQSWNAAELRKWLKRVESPGLIGWVAMNPEMLVYIGFGGLLLALALILATLLLRSRKLPAEVPHTHDDA